MNEVIQPSVSVEQRLADLESQFITLRNQVLGIKPVKKDWRSTVGMMPDDEITRSAHMLGEEWRKQEQEP